eukprot:6179949-Pleurochrysis_carterae.AAC.3
MRASCVSALRAASRERSIGLENAGERSGEGAIHLDEVCVAMQSGGLARGQGGGQGIWGSLKVSLAAMR